MKIFSFFVYVAFFIFAGWVGVHYLGLPVWIVVSLIAAYDLAAGAATLANES